MTPATVMSKIEKLIDNLWWVFVFQGILAILFGLVTLLLPGVTLVVLVYLFAMYIVVLGAVMLVRGLARSDEDALWWMAALLGGVGIATGMILFKSPQYAFGIFSSMVGVILFVRGLFDWFLAAYFVNTSDGKVLWIVSGTVAVIAAITLWYFPIQTSILFIWVLGLYALISGILSLLYADRVRGYLDKMRQKIK